MNNDGTKRAKKEEEYNTEDLELILKNAKVKDMLYKGLQRSMLYKLSSCTSAKGIWDLMTTVNRAWK